MGASRMRLARTLLGCAAVAALAATAACGASTTKSAVAGGSAGTPMPSMSMPGMSAPAPPDGSGGPSASAPLPATGDSVVISNFAFGPATLTVKVGTTVTWTNRDADPHTVTARGGAFKSPTLKTGDTFRYTFTAAGRYDYLCTIHPFMTATVVVTP
jgi:amicyanin